MIRPMCIALLLLLAGIFSFGHEVQARDEGGLRLLIGSVAGIDEAEFRGPSLGPGTMPVDDESGSNIAISGAYRINADQVVGPVFVGGLFFRKHSGTDILGTDYRMNAWGFEFSPGFFVNLSEYLHLEFKLEGGLGMASQKNTASTYSESDHGYLSWGANIGLYGHFADRFILGAEGGILSFRSLGEQNDSWDFSFTPDEDIRYSGTGPTASMVFGVLF